MTAADREFTLHGGPLPAWVTDGAVFAAMARTPEYQRQTLSAADCSRAATMRRIRAARRRALRFRLRLAGRRALAAVVRVRTVLAPRTSRVARRAARASSPPTDDGGSPPGPDGPKPNHLELNHAGRRHVAA